MSVSKMSRLYNNLKTQRRSGQGDEEILQEVYHLYHEDTEKPFKFNDLWKVLSCSPKWKEFEAKLRA